jgi:hypothetical protein
MQQITRAVKRNHRNQTLEDAEGRMLLLLCPRQPPAGNGNSSPHLHKP